MNVGKKVVILGPAHPFRGGIASYNERLARAFIEEGHQCEIYTFTTQYPDFLFPGKTQFSESPPPKEVKITRALSSINPVTWIKLGSKLKKSAPDILIVRYWLPFMAPALGTVARITRHNRHTRIICLIDNIIPHEKRIGDRLLTTYFVNQMDAFLAMSSNVLEELKQFDNQKPRLLNPHPLFDNFGEAVSKTMACDHLRLDPAHRYILFFGLIRDYKGLDILLEALHFPIVKQHRVKAIIAGEYYGGQDRYEKIIEQYQLRDQIIMHTHYIRDEDVKYYFSAADVIVQPYKHATQSGVTQIAYQFDKPMIVTDVGGLPELVPHGEAGLVTTPEGEAIAKAIDAFFNGDPHRFDSGIKAQKARFGWNKLVDQFLKLAE